MASGDEKDDVWMKFGHGEEEGEEGQGQGANGAVVGNFEQPVREGFMFISRDISSDVLPSYSYSALHHHLLEDFEKLPPLLLDPLLHLNRIRSIELVTCATRKNENNSTCNNNSSITNENDLEPYHSLLPPIEEVHPLLPLLSIVHNPFELLLPLHLLPVLRVPSYSRTRLLNLNSINTRTNPCQISLERKVSRILQFNQSLYLIDLHLRNLCQYLLNNNSRRNLVSHLEDRGINRGGGNRNTRRKRRTLSND